MAEPTVDPFCALDGFAVDQRPVAVGGCTG
jgi:hypothetical protein